jgi:hypothetical protein
VSELVVVAGARQVELVAREGARAETLAALGERLVAGLLQNTRFANRATARAALASALPRALDEDDAPVSRSAARLAESAAAWERLVDAVDDALGVVRAGGVDAAALGALEDDQPAARLLRRAMNALDANLERHGLVDERLRWAKLGAAITRAPADEVARLVSATHVRARFLTRWSAADATWWKPMAVALSRMGGAASVELPIVAKAIDATRANDPFEVIVAEVARLLDDAPVEIECATPFGDLELTSAVPSDAHERVVIRHALDAEAQARAVARVVTDALDDGVATDRIAIGFPRGASERAKRALATHFEDMDVALHVGDLDDESSLLHVAFGLLEVGAAGLARGDVADLLRSRALSAESIAGVADARVARAALRDLADTLSRTPSAPSDDPLARLVDTASTPPSSRAAQRGALATRVGAMLLGARGGATRAAHATRARALFAQVGLAARAGGAVRAALARDEPRHGIVAAELDAYARDARAFEALSSALGDVERAGLALGAEDVCSAEGFAHELARALRARGAGGAARAGAVRGVPLKQLAGESLDLLVVVDANDGVLPARASHAGLVPQTLEDVTAGSRSLVDLAFAARDARRIVLCHRAADDDGALVAPSPMVSWLERGGVVSELVHSAPLMGVPTTAHERDLALVAVADDARAMALAPHAAHVAAREIAREAIHATGDSSSARLALTGELRAILEIETGGGARPLSITAVERLARCAFQGFAAQLFGAIDDDARVDDTPDRREEGILVHEALGAAFTAATSLWLERPRNRAAIEDVAMRAADETLARTGGALARAALDRIRTEVVAIVSLAIDDDDWSFAFAERGFGHDGDAWPALVIEREGARLALRGRIDRIDVARDASAVRAIDYKRRVSPPAIVDLGATSIQIPLYAIVARRALGVAGARGRYLSTVSPRAPSAAFDARFAELVAEDADGSTEATRFAIERVVALREGDVGPRPTAPKWCAQCGLDAACRRPRFAVTMIDREDDE